jgi:hypothetical protein
VPVSGAPWEDVRTLIRRANTIDSRWDISAWALTMSLSCVTDQGKSSLDAGLEEIHTASDLNQIVGGEMKVTAARREAIFR